MRYMVISSGDCIEIDSDTSFGHLKDGRMRRWNKDKTSSEWMPVEAFDIAHIFKHSEAVFQKK